MKAKLKALRVAAVVGASAVAMSAHATGPDMTAITGQIDFSTVTPAVLSVAGLLAVVFVAVTGAKMVLAMVKGGK